MTWLKAATRLENPPIERMAQLGVGTDAAVERGAAASAPHRRAHALRAHPRDAAEIDIDARALSDDEHAQLAALAVSWWDGVLTALRARDVERRGRAR